MHVIVIATNDKDMDIVLLADLSQYSPHFELYVLFDNSTSILGRKHDMVAKFRK